jgi:sulfofructose kinase
MKPDVIGVENVIMDFNLLMDEIPGTDGSSKLYDYSWQGGGNVSSAIVAAARLGVHTALVGVAGDDAFGEFCIADYKRHGIDTSHIVIDKGSKTTFVICLAEKIKMGRSFLGRVGTRRQLSEQELDKDFISSAKYLHLGYMGPAQVQAAKWARESGVIVVCDAGGYNKDTDQHTNLIDIFIASENYYKGLFNDENYEANCRAIQLRGPNTVVVTLGSKGCVGLDGDRYFEIPTFTGVDIIDTTGAGDVFHGAFICAMLQGWDAERCARFSSAVSAIKCSRLGGRAGIPDFQTVMRFLHDGTIDYTEIDKRVEFYRDGLVNSVKSSKFKV